MEKISLVILQVTLICSWLTGLFPVGSPLIDSINLRFKWKSFATIFAFLWSILTWSQLQLLVPFLQESLEQHKSLALKFVVVTTSIGTFAYAIISRMIAICCCSRIVQIIQSLKEVQRYCTKFSQCHKTTNYRLIKISGLMCTALVSIRLAYMVRFTNRLLTKLDNSPIKPNEQLSSWATKFIAVAICSNPFLIAAFGNALLISLGNYLYCTHSELMHMLRHQFELRVTDNEDMRMSELAELFVDQFYRLKSCFELYSSTLGFYALSSIIFSFILIIYTFYFVVFLRDDVVDNWALVISLTDPLVIIWSGNILKRQVKNQRREVEEIMEKARFRHAGTHEDLFQAANIVTKWTWEFEACGIFPIDNSLLPSFIGAMATCLTFLVQLQLSEATAMAPTRGDSDQKTDTNQPTTASYKSY